MAKKILYIDMDGVIFDFAAAIFELDEGIKLKYENKLDEIPHLFSKLKPIEKAISSIELLSQFFDVYILSTAPWNNPTALNDKLESVKKYFPKVFYKRLIITHHKNLNKGDFLIDDRLKNGSEKFEGELIQFGTDIFPDWDTVTKYLLTKAE